jgi:Flp pilus assembly CpaF family ATPase
LPHAAIREQLGRGFELIVHLQRRADGRRVVAEVAEVVRAAGGPATRTLVEVGDGD